MRNVPQETPPFQPSEGLTPDGTARVEEILARHQGDPGALIPVLQDINDTFRYLPRAALETVASRMEIPPAEVLRVASFYNAFSLEPVGRHIVEVCLGTACFVRGSGLLLERLESNIGVKTGGTDPQGRFTLRTVRCIGCCALAPAVRIDGITFGKVPLDRTADLLGRFE
ncbi:MAG: NAD(P)H-dependent oxidoreductase subunit E [Thermodesulfobacteriota bacterium]